MMVICPRCHSEMERHHSPLSLQFTCNGQKCHGPRYDNHVNYVTFRRNNEKFESESYGIRVPFNNWWIQVRGSYYPSTNETAIFTSIPPKYLPKPPIWKPEYVNWTYAEFTFIPVSADNLGRDIERIIKLAIPLDKLQKLLNLI